MLPHWLWWPQEDIICTVSLDGAATVWFGYEPYGGHSVDLPVAAGVVDLGPLVAMLGKIGGRKSVYLLRLLSGRASMHISD